MLKTRSAKTRTILILGFLGTLCAGLRSFQAPEGAVVRDVAPDPVLLAGEITTGKLTVSPDTGEVDTFGTWTVTYQVGSQPIRTGGASATTPRGMARRHAEFRHPNPGNRAV